MSEASDYFGAIVKRHMPTMHSTDEFVRAREIYIAQVGRWWLLELSIGDRRILASIIDFTQIIEGNNGASTTLLNLHLLNPSLAGLFVVHSGITGINLIEICTPRLERISIQHLTGYRNGSKIKRSGHVAKARRIKQSNSELTWMKDGIVSSDSLDRYLEERATEGIAITRF